MDRFAKVWDERWDVATLPESTHRWTPAAKCEDLQGQPWIATEETSSWRPTSPLPCRAVFSSLESHTFLLWALPFILKSWISSYLSDGCGIDVDMFGVPGGWKVSLVPTRLGEAGGMRSCCYQRAPRGSVGNDLNPSGNSLKWWLRRRGSSQVANSPDTVLDLPDQWPQPQCGVSVQIQVPNGVLASAHQSPGYSGYSAHPCSLQLSSTQVLCKRGELNEGKPPFMGQERVRNLRVFRKQQTFQDQKLI